MCTSVKQSMSDAGGGQGPRRIEDGNMDGAADDRARLSITLLADVRADERRCRCH